MGSTMSYGGRRRGKTSYGNGGFGGMPTFGYTNIPEEKWNEIDWTDYPKKEKVDEPKKN